MILNSHKPFLELPNVPDSDIPKENHDKLYTPLKRFHALNKCMETFLQC